MIEACNDAGTYVPRFCYHPRMQPVGMCRQCIVEVQGPRGPMLVVSCMTPVAEGQVVHTASRQRQAGAGGRARAVPRQPSARLPGVRQGRRVPAAGPGAQPRSRREPLRRGEAPLREADPDQRPRVARPRALHPVRPLHALRRRGRRRQADPLRQPRQRHPGADVPRRAVRVVLLRQHRADLPGRRAHRHAVPVQGPTVGSRAGREHVHDVLGRLPCGDPVEPRRDRFATRVSTRDPVNWGWLCDRGRFDFQAVNSDERLGAPLVRGESGLVETSWGGALAIAAAVVREASTPVGRTRSGCSAVLAARTRMRTRGPGSPTPSASVSATPRWATGCAPGVLGLDGRRSTKPPTRRRSCSRPRPQRRAAGALPAAARRGREATQPDPRDLAHRPASRSVAWKSVRYEPGGAVRGHRRRPWRSTDVAAQLAKGDVVVVAGRANLAESQGAAVAALAALLDAVPGAKVLPALRRGNVVGALELGLRPPAGDDGPDGPDDGLGVLRAAADGKLDLLVLLGADPIDDCPDADLARRALAGARRVIVDRHVPQRLHRSRPTWCCAAAAFGEQSGTTTNLEGRVTTVAQKVTPRRHGTPRLDDRRRAGDRARPRPRLRIGRRGHRRDRRRGAGLCRHHCGRARDATRRHRHRGLARRAAGRVGRAPATQHATTTGWS